MDQHVTTRLTLENCRTRLLERNEKAALFAFSHETRLVAEVWDLELGVIGFMVSRVPKSAMRSQIGSTWINANGTIRHRADRRCDVTVRVITPPMYYAMPVVIPGFIGFFLFVTFGQVSTVQVLLRAALWLVLSLIGIGVSLRWLVSERAEMLSIVRESLDAG